MMGKEYNVINGISFDARTPDEVCKVLSNPAYGTQNIHNPKRLRIFYGDTDTGRCWMEEHNVTGYIGRSTGKNKIPLMIHSTRSLGGPAIFDHCIVRIQSRKTVLYQHPKFHMPEVTVSGNEVMFDGEVYARFKNNTAANRWAKYIVGDRMCA